MEFGLMVEPQVGGSYKDLLAIALAAEKAGFTTIARSDHYLAGEESEPATDAMTTIAGLARETESIKLAVLVTPPDPPGNPNTKADGTLLDYRRYTPSVSQGN